ncbi:PREDICTED: uncharacterized protein LOC102020117 [Chinchilla lanigera]|uniref:uncharacterized protein LOC102020117 n=1 Tax=Chinchilla lanigera TaxID=34839 RepID=UPI000698C037|nr:PREDICTED: uncharacterized protein LOC102020117 [Chinchilla lanigera]
MRETCSLWPQVTSTLHLGPHGRDLIEDGYISLGPGPAPPGVLNHALAWRDGVQRLEKDSVDGEPTTAAAKRTGGCGTSVHGPRSTDSGVSLSPRPSGSLRHLGDTAGQAWAPLCFLWEFTRRKRASPGTGASISWVICNPFPGRPNRETLRSPQLLLLCCEEDQGAVASHPLPHRSVWRMRSTRSSEGLLPPSRCGTLRLCQPRPIYYRGWLHRLK